MVTRPTAGIPVGLGSPGGGWVGGGGLCCPARGAHVSWAQCFRCSAARFDLNMHMWIPLASTQAPCASVVEESVDTLLGSAAMIGH
jgi:hypothetical protein